MVQWPSKWSRHGVVPLRRDGNDFRGALISVHALGVWITQWRLRTSSGMWRPSPHRRVVSDGPAAYEDEDVTLVIKQWPDDLANEAGTAKYLFGFTVNTFVLGTLRVALRATRVLCGSSKFLRATTLMVGIHFYISKKPAYSSDRLRSEHNNKFQIATTKWQFCFVVNCERNNCVLFFWKK